MLLPERGCWVSLPPRLAAQLLDAGAELPVVVQLADAGPSASSSSAAPAAGRPRLLYAAWQGAVAPSEGALGVPAALAACLGLRQGAPVALRPLLEAEVPRAEAVVVEPLTNDDWEVVELNAGHLEERLLEQAGAAAVGQVLPLWARQAAARLLVTALVPAGLPVARLGPGTELHIAPKPRAVGNGTDDNTQARLLGGGGGSGDGDGADALEAPAPRATWLRVLDAGPDWLLSTSRLGPSDWGFGGGSGSGAGADGSGGAAAAAPAIRSWLTVAVAVSAATAADQGLELGAPVQLCSSTSSGGGGSGGGSAPPRLAALLLRDDALPWGHVSLAPPLAAALGARPLEFVRVEQQRAAKAAAAAPPPRLLESCPAFELRQLVNSEADEAPAAAAATVAAPAAAGSAGAAANGTASTGGPERRQPHHSSGSGGGAAGWLAGLVGTLQGVLAAGLPPLVDFEGIAQSAASAAAAKRGGGGAPPSSEPRAGGGLPGVVPATLAAAVDGWLRLQMAALVARAAVGAGLAPGVRGGGGDGGDGGGDCGDSASSSGVAIPMAGPLLVHLSVGAPHSCGSGGGGGGGDKGGDGGGAQQDHTVVLFPQLPAGGRGAAAPASGWWALPPSALAPAANGGDGNGASPLPKVSVGAPLFTGGGGATAAELGGARSHQQQPSHLVRPSRALRPEAFAWLEAPLAGARRRARARLDLRRWAALRAAGLPAAGGALVCGGSGGGKTALLHLLAASMSGESNAPPAPPPASAAASTTASDPPAPVHSVIVACRALAGARFERAAGAIAAAVAEARARCPGLVMLDDLDALCPAPGDAHDQTQAPHDADTAARLTEWLADLMRWAGAQPRPLAFAASARDAAALPAALRQAGCLDCEVRLPAPGAGGRAARRRRALQRRGCLGGDATGDGAADEAAALARAAERAEGFDARDIEALADRALHVALRRRLGGGGGGGASAGRSTTGGGAGSRSGGASSGGVGGGGGVRVAAADLEAAFDGFVPAAFRAVARAARAAAGGAGAGGGGGGAPEGWSDVGGLEDVRAALEEALELPIK